MTHRIPPNHPPQLLVQARHRRDALVQPLLDRLAVLDARFWVAGAQDDEPPCVAERAGRYFPDGSRGGLGGGAGAGFGGFARAGVGFCRFRGRGGEEGWWGGEELEEGSDVGLVCAYHRITLVDEAQEQTLSQIRSIRFPQRQQTHGRRPKRDAVNPLEAPGQDIQLTLRLSRDRKHVRIQQRGDGAARRMARDEQAVARPARVLLEQLAQARGDGADHLLGDGQEAGVAQVSRVVEEAPRADGRHVEVDGPVHEGGGAADGEDDGVHVVHGDRLDAHGLGAGAPVGRDVGVALGAARVIVDALRVLRGEADDGPCGNIAIWNQSVDLEEQMGRFVQREGRQVSR